MNKSFYIPFIITSLLIILLGNAACNPAYKATATTAQINRSLCAEEWLQFPDQPHPMFQELPGNVSDAQPGIILPAKYIRYGVIEDSLKDFFKYISNSGKKGGIILPVDKHCEPFSLRLSSAMISATQEKYPQIVSLQGNGITNKAADVRIDWNGSQMHVQITFNGAIYYMMPVTEKGKTVYLLYNRDDSGEVKQPFERKPADANKANKVYYDR
jgi:hypothetical protein